MAIIFPTYVTEKQVHIVILIIHVRLRLQVMNMMLHVAILLHYNNIQTQECVSAQDTAKIMISKDFILHILIV